GGEAAAPEEEGVVGERWSDAGCRRDGEADKEAAEGERRRNESQARSGGELP
ncbi:MAG: hypothetical protein GY772_28760, partial [bacterium]|nr:hypothetical protein [bacterium]